jgi:hypothetical protein
MKIFLSVTLAVAAYLVVTNLYLDSIELDYAGNEDWLRDIWG